MNHIYKLALVFLLLLSSGYEVFAQKADEQLAGQYLANGEFRKAADIYEKLLNRNSSSVYFYDNLLNCYLSLKDEDDAVKLVKKQSKRFESNYSYKADMTYVYKVFGKVDKAEELHKQLIKELPLSPVAIQDLSLGFQKRNEKKWAIETLIKGRDILQSPYLFAAELGGLYADLGMTKETVEEYLNVLLLDDSQEEEVQGLLQNYLKSASDYEICKLSLIKRNKTHADKEIFQEMLIWLYVQKNDYNSAIPFVKNLDKKNREEGRRLMDLGYVAMANKRFDDAITVFKQVELYGPDKPYYHLAKQTALESRAKKLLSGNFLPEDLLVLESEYKSILVSTGRSEMSASTIRDLAQLQAYYLNDINAALQNYLEILSLGRLDKRFLANCKLELGDIYIIKGEVWEALLLYGQVDKDFLEDPLGQEAKYRNARLSYLLGEFEWSKAQLDVLKTATTQLIANNAMELSLLIQENTIDSNLLPLQLFSKADLCIIQHQFSKAKALLDSIQKDFPKHELADDILLKYGEIAVKERNYKEAVVYYEKLLNNFGSDILADNALWELANLYEFKLADQVKASQLYEKLLLEYGGSFYVPDARKRFRVLRGDQLNPVKEN
ncbi:MAG: tetratricopeptide repeat protein [Bacteroidia bacterium]